MAARHSIVYFIQAADGGAIKIGISKRLSNRLKALTKIVGRELRVLAVTDGGRPMEAQLHEKFARLRVAGEWFEPGDELLAFIAAEGRPWDGTDVIPVGMAVNLHPDVVAYARSLAALASAKEMTISDLLSGILRPILVDATSGNRKALSLVESAAGSNDAARMALFPYRCPKLKKRSRLTKQVRDPESLINRDLDIFVLLLGGRKKSEIARQYRITVRNVNLCLKRFPASVKQYVKQLVFTEASPGVGSLSRRERDVVRRMITESRIAVKNGRLLNPVIPSSKKIFVESQ